MYLKEKLVLWRLKWINSQGDKQTLKHVKIKDHTVSFRKSEEVLHAYREIFKDGIYTFPSSGKSPFIIDCGAHIGMSVIFFKKLFPGSRILAFEPDPESFGLLQQNTSAFSDVTLEQKAVWVHHNGVNFEQRGDMSSHITDQAEGNIPVKLTASARLRDYITEPVDMLKMDIEGAEIDVLNDCKDQLRLVKNMFVEFHGKADDPGKLEALLAIFRDCNMSYYIKPASDWAPAPFMRLKSDGAWDVQLNIFCKKEGA